MNSPYLSEKIREVRLDVERLSCVDVLEIRDAGRGRPISTSVRVCCIRERI